MKIIPERVIESCHECLYCVEGTMLDPKPSEYCLKLKLEVVGVEIPPIDCPLADAVSESRTDEAFRAILANATDPMTVTAIARSMIAVSDPCHHQSAAGRSCINSECPRKQIADTWSTCPYGKEWEDANL
jgi:hypothetical protein